MWRPSRQRSARVIDSAVVFFFAVFPGSADKEVCLGGASVNTYTDREGEGGEREREREEGERESEREGMRERE